MIESVHPCQTPVAEVGPPAESALDFLDLSPEQAMRVAAGSVEAAMDVYKPVVLFGAGQVGQRVAKALSAVAQKVVAFASEWARDLERGEVAGVPVMTMRDAVARYGKDALFVVCVYTPAHQFLKTRARLRNEYGVEAVSFLHVAFCFPEALLPFYFFDAPQKFFSSREEFRKLYGKLREERSRRELVAHLRLRKFLAFDALPEVETKGFSSVPGLLHSDGIFIDCGAYDGDTVRAFLDASGGSFRRIVAFEPDKRNFVCLADFVRTLPVQLGQKIEVVNKGVWSASGTIGFEANGTQGSAIHLDALESVEVVALDDVVDDLGGGALIKFDVEGAELEALRGAQSLVVRNRPSLAVSVYHRPGDLWQVPEYLDGLACGYEYYLRSQGGDGADLMLYAIPPQSGGAN